MKVICGIGLALLVACGGGGGDNGVPFPVNPPPPIDAPPLEPPTPLACGDALAAIDLSGTCRLNPPTPGALEVRDV